VEGVMKFIQSYYTDVGIKRKCNQDSLALIKADTDFGEVLLAIICDGMGGHQSGELASKVCIKNFSKWFKTKLPHLLYTGLNYEWLKDEWHDLICDTNASLVRKKEESGVEMGSTATAFLFVKGKYYAVHVGDCRGYEITNKVRQITKDHSLVALKVEQGLLTREEAKSDKRANILLESIGITKSVNMEFYTGDIQSSSSFLICTDGLWHQLKENEIERYLSKGQITNNKMLRMHLNFLTETVKNRGEKDNISAIGVIPVVHEEHGV